MAKGIIYIMKTCVKGLIKIGKTRSDNFEQRMAHLEKNGYGNVTGLVREYAIETDEYDKKERLLHEIFSKSRVSNIELFSIDIDLVKNLLSSLKGEVVYPQGAKQEDIFKESSEMLEIKKGIIPNGSYTLKTKIKDVPNFIEATMTVDGEKFYIEPGARLAPICKLTVKGWVQAREKVKMNGYITESRILCNSPSMAASIVCGHHKNGWKTWKNSEGQYIDVYREMLNDDKR